MDKTRKETGLILSPEMVLANMENRKSQTRPTRGLEAVNVEPDMWTFDGFNLSHSTAIFCRLDSDPPHSTIGIKCPFGAKGDLIYQKETWSGNKEVGLAYKATNPELNGAPWKSPMSMPKWAARKWYVLTADPMPHRVQSISEDDAFCEGVEIWPISWCEHPEFGENSRGIPAFQRLWNSVVGEKPLKYKGTVIEQAYTWERNPWCWGLEYKPCERPKGI